MAFHITCSIDIQYVRVCVCVCARADTCSNTGILTNKQTFGFFDTEVFFLFISLISTWIIMIAIYQGEEYGASPVRDTGRVPRNVSVS